MIKFSKEYWRVEGDMIKTAISAGNKHIAMVNYFDCGIGDPRSINLEEHEANVRLIAAAPRMYFALKRQVDNIDKCIETGIPASAQESKDIYEQMKDAIKDVTGE